LYFGSHTQFWRQSGITLTLMNDFIADGAVVNLAFSISKLHYVWYF